MDTPDEVKDDQRALTTLASLLVSADSWQRKMLDILASAYLSPYEWMKMSEDAGVPGPAFVYLANQLREAGVVSATTVLGRIITYRLASDEVK